MQSCFQLNWVVDPDSDGLLIKDFLKNENISKTALTDIKFKGGNILVDHMPVTVRYRLSQGQQLTVIFPPETPAFEGENIELSIQYEDEFLLVVNKPYGMSTIPSREHPTGSLVNALISYYKKTGLSATAHIVTRLDRNTSGLVLIAKHRHIHHLFSLMQKSGTVKRTYEAFACGTIEEGAGTINAPIGRSPESIIVREVRSDGQYACTHYQVIERLSALTHVQLKLETGRTHQIRVHMSYLGHPLLGDDLYGGDIRLMDRQALHCKEIRFIHPFSQQELTFSAALPEDMDKILRAARK